MVAHICRPHPLLARELCANVPDGLGEKRAGSCGGVENLDTVHFALKELCVAFPHLVVVHHLDAGLRGVRESGRKIEVASENCVHAADDEPHDRSGRIPDASLLAESRVVSREEVLVEMEKRVGLGS